MKNWITHCWQVSRHCSRRFWSLPTLKYLHITTTIRIRNQEATGLTFTYLLLVATPRRCKLTVCVQANSTSYPHRDGKRAVAYLVEICSHNWGSFTWGNVASLSTTADKLRKTESRIDHCRKDLRLVGVKEPFSTKRLEGLGKTGQASAPTIASAATG